MRSEVLLWEDALKQDTLRQVGKWWLSTWSLELSGSVYI